MILNKYKFSIIMAVYNVEPFLDEAIQSLLNQTIGFEDSVQLILVNDGSLDTSGLICDKYAEKYPDNIVAIHKKNGGVSSARNAGIPLIEGKYVNFLDSDDKLTANTLSVVYNFFEKNYNKTDVVSIPLVFFDGQTGEHGLNYKFQRGTRLINLKTEYNCIQLSLPSAFIKQEDACQLRFDEQLNYGEDAKECLKLLMKKMTLGVVAEGEYQYRKRSQGESSALQSGAKTKEWYIPYTDNFCHYILNYAKKRFGNIPRFVQYSIMHNLQWRIRPQHIPVDVLTVDEEKTYQERLFSLARYFDDDIILNQKSITTEHKLFLLKKKYGKSPKLIRDITANDVVLAYNDVIYKPAWFQVMIHHIDAFGEKIYVEYTQTIPNIGLPIPKLYVNFAGELFPSVIQEYENNIYSVGVKIGERLTCRAQIPYAKGKPKGEVKFVTQYGNLRLTQKGIGYGNFSPLKPSVQGTHYYKNGVMFRPSKAGFTVEYMTKTDAAKNEMDFCISLFKKKDSNLKKVAFTRLITRVGRKLKKKQIWLVCDKADRADDNGEAFFKYIQQVKPKNVEAYFLIKKDSPDYERLKKIGPVVSYMSFKHKLLYLKADFIISAYSNTEINNPFLEHSKYFADLLQHCKYVFLQHGITKDDVSPALNRFQKNISLFICATRAEYDSIIKNPKYGYSTKEVALTGFARYDNLYHDEKNEIVIMPTWRRNLFGSYHAENSQWDLKPGFEESDYYQFYNSLLNSERLLSAAKENGYKINFVPHPVLFPYINCFHVPQEVTLWDAEVIYRDMFAQNKLLLTDFSSVAFDFAYLRKPVIYAHFDTNHYEEGYFNYEQDGFGEVEYDLEGTIDRIIEYMRNDCQLKTKYRDRIDKFFTYNDQNNCQRILSKIMQMKR